MAQLYELQERQTGYALNADECAIQRQSLVIMQQGSQGFFGILVGASVYLYQQVKLSCGLQYELGGYRGGDMLEFFCIMQKFRAVQLYESSWS